MSQDLNRRNFLSLSASALGAAAAFGSCAPSSKPAARTASGAATRSDKPNVVIIFCDDLAYADVGCFGAQGYSTPNIDRMAGEGVRFTDFHAATAVCSASRAALLTGCYPERVSIQGALGPKSTHGISDNELLISEMFKEQGYVTSCVGKWHLGYQKQFLPTHHGFDQFFGLPYSNDMWDNHPEFPEAFGKLPLIEGEDTIAWLEDQRLLTTWYADRSVEFIRRNAGKPFFLYLAHNMPHVPLFVSDKFKGRTGRGLFGDVIEEIDWSVGRVLDELKAQGVDDNTLVIFTSDNGPWMSYGDHCGSALPFREGKGTMFEGGMREPCVMRWPGRIKPGAECDRLATTMDILPTLAALCGGKLPDHKIDGHDIRPLIFGEPGAQTPWEAYWCYWNGALHAVRTQDWKLHFPHPYRTLNGRPGGTGGLPVKYEQAEIGLSLFDMVHDKGETTDVAAQHPEVVKQLEALAEKARADLGDAALDMPGPGIRPPGMFTGDDGVAEEAKAGWHLK
jgi:arylsulfatase A-like enzyme